MPGVTKMAKVPVQFPFVDLIFVCCADERFVVRLISAFHSLLEVLKEYTMCECLHCISPPTHGHSTQTC